MMSKMTDQCADVAGVMLAFGAMVFLILTGIAAVLAAL